MSAYVLLIRDKSRDAGQLAIYDKLAPSTFQEHPAKFLVFHGTPEVLEGALAEDVMLAVFPSQAEAKSWYRSASYTEARAHRNFGGDFRCLIVEGAEVALT